MSFDQIKDWLAVINFVATAVVGIFVWITGQDKATNDRISEMEGAVDKRLDEHNARLTTVEADLRSAPTHEDIRELRTEQKSSNTKLDQLLGESRARNRSLERIEQYLLDTKP